jgi:HK97 family phage prohead protease
MERITFGATGTMTGNTLEGVAHTYGTRAAQGSGYVEFAPGSFKQALRKADVRAFVNHNTDLILGRTTSGTVRLSDEADGLHYAIDLPETSYAADLKAVVARGDVTEMSFGILPGAMKVLRADDGRQVQLHTQVKELFDISPTALPAFTSTSVELHSMGNTPGESAQSQAVRVRQRAHRKETTQ